MADHELELAAKFGIPEIHGLVARLEARYKASWTTRGRQLTQAVEETSGLHPTELEARLEDNEPLRDILWTALNRAVQVSDPDYIDALGRLVAAALDPAKIDEVGYLIADITRLDPVHLRVLLATYTFWGDGDIHTDPRTASVAAAREPHPMSGYPDTVLAEELKLSAITIDRVVNRLINERLLERLDPNAPTGGPSTEFLLQPTGAAGQAIQLMFPNIGQVEPERRRQRDD